MTSLHIRDARPDEIQAIRDLTVAAYEQYAPVMSEFWELYRENIVTTIGGSTPVELIVAEQGEQLVGSVLLYPAGTETVSPDGDTITLKWPEIRLLAVPPSARGQGVGAALMRECIARARKAGCAALTLHTTDMMSVAMQMYERMGFQRAPDIDFHPAPDVTIKGYRFDLEKTPA